VLVVEAILEEVHTAVEHTEDTLFASEEIKDENEYHQHAEAPVSLSEQPLVEESLPIVEEFAPVPAGARELRGAACGYLSISCQWRAF
jgi:hypothetical protein